MIDQKAIREAQQAIKHAKKDISTSSMEMLDKFQTLAKQISVSISEALGEIPDDLAPVYAHVLGKYRKGIIEHSGGEATVNALDKLFEPTYFCGDEATEQKEKVKAQMEDKS